MLNTAPPDVVTPDEAIRSATASWSLSGAPDRHHAQLKGWTTGTALDGSPMVTAEVTGPEAERAMWTFAGQYPPAAMGPGACKPLFTCHEGRLECAWRSGGVWVRLWAPEQRHPKPTAPQTPRPATKPPTAAVRPSARLPYRRNTTTPKEN